MTSSIDLPPHTSDNPLMEARIARIETHVEHLNANVTDLRAGLSRLDAKVDDVYRRLDAKIDDLAHRVDMKFEAMGRRIDGVEHRLDAKIDALASKVDRHLLVLGGMMVSLGVGMAGLMAKGFHWL